MEPLFQLKNVQKAWMLDKLLSHEMCEFLKYAANISRLIAEHIEEIRLDWEIHC